jgi:hypothetical protein
MLSDKSDPAGKRSVESVWKATTRFAVMLASACSPVPLEIMDDGAPLEVEIRVKTLNNDVIYL